MKKDRLSAVERETIILYNEAENTAEVYTHSYAMKKRIEDIQRRYPEEVKLAKRDGIAYTYILPKKWVKIIPPRRASAKQLEHLAQLRNR